MEDETVFIASCAGDPSVGISGQQAEIRFWVPPDEPEHLEFVKEALTEAFSNIWDERATVYTEDELGEEIEAENEALDGSDEDFDTELD